MHSINPHLPFIIKDLDNDLGHIISLLTLPYNNVSK